MSYYCKVWINGEERELEAERRLLDVLRKDCPPLFPLPRRFMEPIIN